MHTGKVAVPLFLTGLMFFGETLLHKAYGFLRTDIGSTKPRPPSGLKAAGGADPGAGPDRRVWARWD